MTRSQEKNRPRIRAKSPPEKIVTAVQARDAFERLIEYRRMERLAYTRARMYQRGTRSARINFERGDASSRYHHEQKRGNENGPDMQSL